MPRDTYVMSDERAVRSRLSDMMLRTLFLVLALLALWAGIVCWNVWAVLPTDPRPSIPEGPPSITNWVIWLLVVALAGFLFAIAVMPPSSLRYRIGPPLLLAAVPVLLLAQTIAIYGLHWEALPMFLATPRFYMNSPFQFGLATWVGVALVAGFHSPAVQ